MQISKILYKDVDSNHRWLFNVSVGSTANDPSLYVSFMNHGLPDDIESRKKLQKLADRRSYHTIEDLNGLVESHIKVKKINGVTEYFGIEKQIPLSKRKHPLYDYSLQNVNMNQFLIIPEIEIKPDDIILSFSNIDEYRVIFYMDKVYFDIYCDQHNYTLLKDYKINTPHSYNVNVALVSNIKNIAQN